MSDHLEDLSTLNLLSAIEENLFSNFISVARKWSRAEVHEDAEIMWTMTDVPFPLFNSIFRAQLPSDKIDATIQSLLAQGSLRNIPLLWWTGPATHPDNLGDYLLKHGFIQAGVVPGMAVDLEHLNENLPAVSGLSVKAVRDTETMQQWIQTCITGFGMPDSLIGPFSEFMSQSSSGEIQPYLGLLNNQPVATSLMVLAEGVAGLYNIATIPEARRKGIGAWMTLIPLLEARTQGYRAGILHASEMGIGVYRSLGFQEYCQIGQYAWFPTSGN